MRVRMRKAGVGRPDVASREARIVFLLGLGLLAPVPVASQAPAATAFVDVAVIPMDRERVLVHQTVLVQGDRIVALGPAKRVPVPAGAQRIDGRGKFLIPGLADMHSHSLDTVSLFVYVANGVMTVRNMTRPMGNRRWRAPAVPGEFLGPRVSLVGWADDCHDSKAPVSIAQCVASMKAAGYNMVKFYGGDSTFLDSVAAAAKQLQLPVGGHTLPGPGLAWALRVPYHSIEHLWGYVEYLLPDLPSPANERTLHLLDANPSMVDTMASLQPGYRLDPKQLHDVAVATQRAGIWNAPTLVEMEPNPEATAPDSAGNDPFSRLAHGRFALNLQVVKALQDAGAGLLLSMDVLGGVAAGFTVHRELDLLVQAGLTPYQALTTGTRNVAVYFGTQDSAGTVAVGKRADLVLLDGNPLQDIHYTAGPAGVMVGGRWLSRAAIEAHLDTLAASGCDLRDLQRQAVRHQVIGKTSIEAARC